MAASSPKVEMFGDEIMSWKNVIITSRDVIAAGNKGISAGKNVISTRRNITAAGGSVIPVAATLCVTNRNTEKHCGVEIQDNG